MTDGPHSPPHDGSPPKTDDLQELLTRCIDAIAETGKLENAEPVIRGSGALASALRERLAKLHRAGLLPVGETTEAAPASHPERLGDFRLLRPLGRGGMGVVYLAVQESLGREVALKLVHPELLYFPGARERFRREVAVIARLEDPGIVPIHTVGEVDGIPYFAMEYVAGANLAEVIETLRPRNPSSLRGSDLHKLLIERAGRSSSDEADLFAGSWPDTCARIVQRMALAAHHAHERGVLHRDLKPSNAMITPRGRVLLLDFGLASADGATSLTRSGAVVGTLHYMAPEQVRGEAIDARSEVYSLAATLYELLTLTPPHDAASADALRSSILDRTPSSPRLRNPEVTRDLAKVVLIALDRDPAHRYATGADFAADLGRCLERRPILARPPGVAVRARRWTQRHPAAALAFLLSLVAGIGITLLMRERDDAERSSRTNLDSAVRAIASLVEQARDPRLIDVPGLDATRERQLAEAVELLDQVRRANPSDPRIRLSMFVTAGEVAALQTQLGRADAAFATADAVLRELAADPSTVGPSTIDSSTIVTGPASLLAEASLLRARANARRQLGAFDDAKRDTTSALQRLAGISGPLLGEALDLRATCLVDLAALESAAGNPRGAHAHLSEAIAIDERRIDAASSLARILDSLRTLDNLANSLQKLGQPQDALSALDKGAGRFAELLARHPREPHLRRESLRNQAARASALRALERYPEALGLIAEAASGFDDLIREYPDRIAYAWSRSMLDYEAGQTAEAAGSFEQAKQLYGSAIEKHRALLARAPGHREYAADAALFVTRLARIAVATHSAHDLELDALLEEGIAWQAPLCEANPADRYWRRNLIQLRNQLGRLRLEQDRPQDARAQFESLAELYSLERDAKVERAEELLIYSLRMLTIAQASADDQDAAMATLRRLVTEHALSTALLAEMGHELHLEDREDFAALRELAAKR
ncbi:MAG: protein kinase [Planctomycetota bacterium]